MKELLFNFYVGVSPVLAYFSVTTSYHGTCSHASQFAGKPSHHLYLGCNGKAIPNAFENVAIAKALNVIDRNAPLLLLFATWCNSHALSAWLTVALRTSLCIILW